MCCREGVDKAPKAPKGTFVSAASLNNLSHPSGHIINLGRITTVKRSGAPRVPGNEQMAEEEIVDLASGQGLRHYEKQRPKAFKGLNYLHEKNVTTGSNTPVAMKNQSTFNNIKGKQPQIPFLTSSVSAETSSDKPSTNYDPDWMGDLPSPFALLRKPCEKVDSLPEHTSTDEDSSWPDGLPSPSALIRQNDAATGKYPDTSSLEGPDLSHFNDEESEIEAAMVGLSDSVTMQDSEGQAAAGQTSSQADAYPDRSPSPKDSGPKLYHCPSIEWKSSGTSRLFLSTQSPEKVAEPGQKRKAGVTDGSDAIEDLSQSAPVPKRLRVNYQRGQGPRGSSSAERQTLSPTKSIVKSGLPAWVHDFDADFIAEWQDLVDFI